MRVWRVGTFSMGASLLFLGVILLFSQFFNLKLYKMMIAWWPAILVVLGIEILVFLFFNKHEKPFLKYDFLSIFFVGVIGMIGIGFVLLSSTGLMEKVTDVMESQEQTMELPPFIQKVDAEIKRIVVKTEQYPITIEATPNKEVSMFGTYRTVMRENEKLINQSTDFLHVQQNGDTLYIEMKDLPSQTGPFDYYATVSATLLVPSNVKLEVIGRNNNIRLQPRTLLSDWSIENASEVSLHVEEDDDLTVKAESVQQIIGQEGLWKITEQKSEVQNELENGSSDLKSAVYQSGKGTHHISIFDTYQVEINKVK
ncbi:hypothetical protein ACFSO7_21990 [Bacillus sp. CGMCC 1.16607]|uniref:hypothetical protein n=1 Tax=Bacillus sp. CGMCC 1.16607 TaxID=3351842 RepID=UPI00364415C7